jgi:twitching motility protein PilI
MADSETAIVPARAPRASRTRLREFQAGLAERLRQAATMPSTQSRLAFRITGAQGDRHYLVDLPEAGEILSVPEITPVPLTKGWFLGLANVRGSLLSVVDLTLLTEGGTTQTDKDSRVLAFSPELRFNAGILVTRMMGLRNAAQLEVDDAASLPGAAPWIGKCFRDTDGVKWEELRLAGLTTDDRFLQIGIW